MMNLSTTRRVFYGLAAATFLAVAPAPASAGTYNVYSCSGSNGVNHSWTFQATPAAMFTTANNCSTGGALLPTGVDTRGALVVQTNPGQTASAANGYLQFSAPAGTTITSLTYDRHLQVFNDDFWRVATSTDDGELEGCQVTGTTTQCNVWATGPSSGISFSGLSSQWIRLTATCTVACDGGGAAASASVVFNGGVVTLSDPTNPISNALAGSLPNASNSTGTKQVTISGSDQTGVRNVDLLIDGNLANTTSNGACDFHYSLPCAQIDPSFSSTFAVDTSALAPGSHTLTGRVYDAAGNLATSTSSFTAAAPPVVPPVTPPTTPQPITPRNSYIRVTSTSLKNGTLKVGGLIHSQASGQITVKVRYRDSKRKLRSKTYTATKSGQKWSINKRLTVPKVSLSVSFAGNSPWISTSVVKSLSVQKK